MKLIRFGIKGEEAAGIVDANGDWRDVSAVVPDWTGETVNQAFFKKVGAKEASDYPLISKETRLGAPIGNVPKIIGCALTYGKHAQEAGLETPKEPMIMLTARTAINGPYDEVIMPRGCTELDWEAELVVIMGKGGKHIAVEDAMGHVAGYAVGNDVSERQFQLVRSTQWTKGKSADTLKPIGPWLVTKDEIADPNKLDISMQVSGVTRQSSNCLLYTSPSPRDKRQSRMPSSA